MQVLLPYLLYQSIVQHRCVLQLRYNYRFHVHTVYRFYKKTSTTCLRGILLGLVSLLDSFFAFMKSTFDTLLPMDSTSPGGIGTPASRMYFVSVADSRDSSRSGGIF